MLDGVSTIAAKTGFRFSINKIKVFLTYKL